MRVLGSVILFCVYFHVCMSLQYRGYQERLIHHDVRGLDAHTAFQGLAAKDVAGCVTYSRVCVDTGSEGFQPDDLVLLLPG